MDNQKQQVAERIKEANNILVTVSSNPSVDQLAACIGLTLSLNKMGKHATAVFSGGVPSTIEFLQPEKTLERNTDSLRDFIIALDKSKADKLRYKVEDRVVKIFITPYRTSIGEKDLEFSQGDFNVDVVLALGVHNQPDLDQAITSHGRILHDATVITVNVHPGGELGGMNWLDAGASSLSELSAQLIAVLDKKLIDGQIATAFLTGIVAETERFSNAKTSPQTMSTSADLMAAGANQQLVATKLEAPAPPPPPPPLAHSDDQGVAPVPASNPDGTLEIAHDDRPKPPEPIEEPPEPEEPAAPQIHIDEHGDLQPVNNMEPKPAEPEIRHPDRPYLADPTQRRPSEGGGMLDGAMTSPMSANVTPDGFAGPHDPLGLPDVDMPLLDRGPLQSEHGSPQGVQVPTIIPPNNGQHNDSVNTEAALPEKPEPQLTPMPDTPPPPPAVSPFAPEPTMPYYPPPAAPAPAPVIEPTVPAPTETLTQIEQDVKSPHLQQVAPPEPPAPSLTFNPQPAAPQPAPPAPTPVSPVFEPAPQQFAPDTTPSANVDDARDLVQQAINSAPNSAPQPPIAALNAQPLGAAITPAAAPQPSTAFDPAAFGATDAAAIQAQPSTATTFPPVGEPQPVAQGVGQSAPPPVPPPMLPPTYPS